MTRIIDYFKYLLLSWLSKGKTLWNSILMYVISKVKPEEPENPTYVNAEKYQSMFEDSYSIDDVQVLEQIWNRIHSSVPTSFKLPHEESIKRLHSMRSDNFDSLFAKPSSFPELFVDPSIWNRISHSLPSEYVLPHPSFENITKPMRGTFYDQLFSRLSTTDPNIFVDNRVWEPITSRLPRGYSLPDPNADTIFNAVEHNTFHPMMPRERLNQELTDVEIQEKIINSLPKNYSIPNFSFFGHTKDSNHR
ncbi:hypothetical protein [Paenisporosarcina sp. NPDC076907]|uniref:hypothetical protein n=2 Tax=unclassified Paenisporosarcina TaxID=2642018 RepID=UPI003CFC3CF0